MLGKNECKAALPESVHCNALPNGSLFKRLLRTISFAAIGYIVYFFCVYVVSLIDPSISTLNLSWRWGGIVAFAFASSECFYLETFNLLRSKSRRLIMSSLATLACFFSAHIICKQFELSPLYYHEPPFLRRIVIALALFSPIVALVGVKKRGRGARRKPER